MLRLLSTFLAQDCGELGRAREADQRSADCDYAATSALVALKSRMVWDVSSIHGQIVRRCT
jgi:hypothetical protein